MRLTLLTYLSFFLLVNLIGTQAFAAPSSSQTSSQKSKKTNASSLNANSTPAKIDNSDAGYRLLAQVLKKNQKMYSKSKLKTSSKKGKKRR